MRASEKMALRARFHDRLVEIDASLAEVIISDMTPNRRYAAAQLLLEERRGVCEALRQAGYQPWPIPKEILAESELNKRVYR